MPKCPSHSGLKDSQALYGDQLEPLFPQVTPNDSFPHTRLGTEVRGQCLTAPLLKKDKLWKNPGIRSPREEAFCSNWLPWHGIVIQNHRHDEAWDALKVFNLHTQEPSVLFEVHITEIPTVPKERNLVLQIYTHGLEFNRKLFPPFCLIPKHTMLR